MTTRILLLPGLFNSGPEHWQSYWERSDPACHRVNQRDWDTPSRAEWVATLEHAVERAGAETVLVAHSTACALVAFWTAEHPRVLRGALLVAPSDTEAPSYPRGPTGFQPMPLGRLPFPSVVAASTDDEFVSLERATRFAEAWGSRLVSVGACGHINSASGLGAWPAGRALLDSLLPLRHPGPPVVG